MVVIDLILSLVNEAFYYQLCCLVKYLQFVMSEEVAWAVCLQFKRSTGLVPPMGVKVSFCLSRGGTMHIY